MQECPVPAFILLSIEPRLNFGDMADFDTLNYSMQVLLGPWLS